MESKSLFTLTTHHVYSIPGARGRADFTLLAGIYICNMLSSPSWRWNVKLLNFPNDILKVAAFIACSPGITELFD